ncbi:IS110 family transposase, partial [Vibrio kyushuensis]
MNNDSIIFIGLDTHKSFIQVAVLQGNRGAVPQHMGRIKSNKSA